jgi:hypothetical protein
METKFILLIAFPILIVLEALRDANNTNNWLNIRNNAWLWHMYKSIMILIYLILIGIIPEQSTKEIIIIISSYTLLRLGLFDLTYNIATFKDHPMQYLGNTSILDKVLKNVLNKPNIRTLAAWLRFLCLFVAIYVILELL